MRNNHDTSRILRAAMSAWPAERGIYRDGWYFRQSEDPTKRVNSVWPLAAKDCGSLDERIDAAETWYRDLGQSAIFQLTASSAPADLDRALERRGYGILDPSRVNRLELAYMPFDDHIPAGFQVELECRPTQLVMNALLPNSTPAQARLARARLFNAIGKPRAFAVVTMKGVPVAGGLAVVDEDLAGLFNMHTHTQSRRQGLARAVLGRLLRWSRNLGAKTAYLQIDNRNDAAIRLYAGHGFRHDFDYHYRRQTLIDKTGG